MRCTRSALLLLLALSPCRAPAGPLAEAATLHSRASSLADQERYIEAEAAYRATIRLIERELGAAAAELARPLNNLAVVYRRLGRLRDAERGYLRSLQIREESGDKVGAARVHVNLARLYLAQGRKREATAMLAKVASEKEVRPELLHTRAALLLDAREFKAAAETAARARDAWIAEGRGADAAKARAMRGEALRLAGRAPQAADELQKAVDELRATLGPRHPETGRATLAYGNALRALGHRRLGKQLRAEGRAILADAPDRAAREHIVDARAGYTRSR